MELPSNPREPTHSYHNRVTLSETSVASSTPQGHPGEALRSDDAPRIVVARLSCHQVASTPPSPILTLGRCVQRSTPPPPTPDVSVWIGPQWSGVYVEYQQYLVERSYIAFTHTSTSTTMVLPHAELTCLRPCNPGPGGWTAIRVCCSPIESSHKL